MKILMIHKFYYIEGGAERYVFSLSDLLRNNGDQVIPFAMHHKKNFPSEWSEYFAEDLDAEELLKGSSKRHSLSRSLRFVYNQEAQNKLEILIEKNQPNMAHVHSIYHHLSPSILFTLKKYDIPIIQTLHDYKLICPNYIFLDRHENVCEACRGKRFWHATTKKCFRDSYAASFLVTVEAYLHKLLNSYKKNVDLFVSPSEFLRSKMIQYGYPSERVITQPYTIPTAEYIPNFKLSDYIVFLGRLTYEKGVGLLIDAMRAFPKTKLLVLGTGPLERHLRGFVAEHSMKNIQFGGYLAGGDLKKAVARAKFTVVPSIWYDNSPLVIYESMALGKAVLGSRIGGIPELIDEGVTGFTFESNNREDLIDKIARLLADDTKTVEMGKVARRQAEKLFSPQEHYKKIQHIYNSVRNDKSVRFAKLNNA
jgi:glycosyltransferase involved in cell wall biosynthesis